MSKGPIAATLAVLVLGSGALYLAWRYGIPGAGHGADDHSHPHPHEGEHDHDEPARGPRGGRLLKDSAFACEVTIFESGVPPEYRVYPSQGGKPLDPAQVRLTITLRRLLGRVDTIGFAPQGEYLRGDRVVEEPHSFDVTVVAEYGGARHEWGYASHEGRVELPPELAATCGVVVEAAGPATIRSTLRLHGRLVPDPERLAHIKPRFAGVVEEVRKRLGDPVAKGEPLAVIQSSDSLQSYTVAAPVAGTILQKHVTAGEVAHEDEELFEIGDLGLVWAVLDVPWKDAARVKPGQPLLVHVEGESAPRASAVSQVSPVGTAATQSVRLRAELSNADGKLWPGLFVSADVVLEEVQVPLAVRASGLQRFRDWDVVFVQDGSLFEVRPLQLGRRDAEWVEVTSGIEPAQRYAAAGSFLLKADAGKAGASHDH